jgi:Xaa-Pro aminopeptidase
MAVLLQEKSAFFTDGRYTLQAAQEVPPCYEIHNSADIAASQWLAEECSENASIAYDPWLMTEQQLRPYREAAIALTPLTSNPIDSLWKNRPAASRAEAVLHPIEFSGCDAEVKIEAVIADCQAKSLDAFLLTAPDSICWLLNIRGGDVDHTPLLLGYALLGCDGKITLLTEESKIPPTIRHLFGDRLSVMPLEKSVESIKEASYQRIGVDISSCPIALMEAVGDTRLLRGTDPCILPKALKNDVEQQGARNAHIRDGVALTEFLHWVENTTASGKEITELECSKKLIELRSKQAHFKEPSFESIVGFAGNGAIVHYRVTEESNRSIKGDGLLLVDSGGQYRDGTTDVTRTIAIGNPTEEHKTCYTRVLKGHIALARALFPTGTTGAQIDTLARNALWQIGLDYDHGTGHGVGSYLGVHEGPQGISKRSHNIALQPGMIVSNEPGYYQTDAFGIRIESLILITASSIPSEKPFLCSETLTCAPLSPQLIDAALLDDAEKKWLYEYHHWVQEKLSSALPEATRDWLAAIVKQFEAMAI